MRYVTILGATGSIGSNALSVISQHPDRYRIYALTAYTQKEKLLFLCLKFQPKFAVVNSPDDALWLEKSFKSYKLNNITVLYGHEGLCVVASASKVDIVIAAIVGAIGLPSALAAANAGKRILLANKEALVMAGRLFMRAIVDAKAELLPIDSEHNAIFQCLPQGRAYYTSNIAHITLTASGGPFLNKSLAQLDCVTPEEACAHPIWSMGKKISIDSATMMNKGLEMIEAYWLFAIPRRLIKVLIHTQSIIHSMVSYIDGSILAQMGSPDMRIPIAQALAYPERIATNVNLLDLVACGKLEFSEVNLERFPCLRLAIAALEQLEQSNNNSSITVLLNAANEIAVQAFLNKQISFTSISKIVERILSREYQGFDYKANKNQCHNETLELILELDKKTRADTLQVLRNI